MRRSFSLLEVIFSIVVLGTLLTAIPTFLRGLQQIEREILLKDLIVTSASKLQQIVTYRWDENGRDGNVTYSRIVDVDSSSGDINYSRKASDDTGRVSGLYNREFFIYQKDSTSPESLGKEGDEVDDIDDWNNREYTITVSKVDSNIRVSINYIDDSITIENREATLKLDRTSLSRTSNIKLVRVDVTPTADIYKIESFNLSVLTTNIGEMEFKRRELE